MKTRVGKKNLVLLETIDQVLLLDDAPGPDPGIEVAQRHRFADTIR